MDADAKKTELRMIPYGIYVLITKATELDGASLNGHGFTAGANGAPILDDALASVECRVVEIVEHGDHHVVLGEVTAAQVAPEPPGRPDEAILEMKDLGEKVVYGG